MPRQKPGKSEQDVQTPPEFTDAVVRRFGPIAWDLAATEANRQCKMYLGPGKLAGAPDSFAVDWHKLAKGLLWLNPPYSNIRKWARKCAHEAVDGAKIALLVPAAVGSNWFADYVDGKALVLLLRPRLTFIGHKHAYPKDLMLCVYGERPGIETWRWK